MRTSDPGFLPPFCPNPACSHHTSTAGWRWKPHGTFRRRAVPRVVHRFQCLSCRRSFSTQTFDTTYWLKRPELQRPLFRVLVACSGLRQAARTLQAAHATLQRQASRLGRHCLLFQRAHEPGHPVREELALDGLLSFEYSQYWPFELNVLVGTKSQFFYAFTESELRRSGRMTAFQERKRRRLEERWGRPDPRATRHAVRELVRGVISSPGLAILTDEHLTYPRAFRELGVVIEHRTYSSRRCRTHRNPLHSVDHLDALIRHSSANHKRETIAFSKRRQGALERIAVFQVWRNFLKGQNERDRLSPTPAQALGVFDRRLDLDDLLAQRLFPSRVELPPAAKAVYWRTIPTRQVPNATRHVLRFAA